MEDSLCEEVAVKIKIFDIYKDNGICKFKDTNLPLNGKYEDEIGTIHYFKNGKCHNENGPAYIAKDGDYYWYINGRYIHRDTMDNWLRENDIPLDWNTWTDSDKMLFALHWSDYNG